MSIAEAQCMFCLILLQEAESSFSERESSLIELEYNLHEQRELINRQCHEIESLNEKLNFEVKKIKSLERESDRLRAEISLLESKVHLTLIL